MEIIKSIISKPFFMLGRYCLQVTYLDKYGVEQQSTMLFVCLEDLIKRGIKMRNGDLSFCNICKYNIPDKFLLKKPVYF